MNNAKKKVLNKNFGLKARILIITMVTIICTAATLSSFAYINSKNVIKEKSLETVEEKIKIVNDKMSALTEQTEALAGAIISTDYLKKDMTEEDHKALMSYFEKLSANYPEVVNFLYCSAAKYHIYPESPDFEGFRPDDADFFHEFVESDDKGMWMQPNVDQATGKLVMVYYKKVVINGEYAGIMEIDVSVEHIKELVNATKIGEEGYIMLSDYQGLVAIHNNEELTGQEIPDAALKEFAINSDEGSLDYKDSEGKKLAVIQKFDCAAEFKAIGIISEKELMSDARRLLVVIVICTIIIAILSIIIVSLLIGRITKNIEAFLVSLSKMGEGDLCVKSSIERNDEIGKMSSIFNVMVSNLNSLLAGTKGKCNDMIKSFEEMNEISTQSMGASKEITDSIERVAESAYEQAKETETIVNNFDDLAHSMMDISTSLNSINGLFDETKAINSEGIQVVNNLLETTDKTNKTTEAVQDKINEISISSSEINSIVETITAIAEQTNLLSLNASIEAARAGEMGKGFAVVADEVRKLAEESSNSAKEIKDIIGKIQQQTSGAVSEVQEAKRSMDIQTEAVHDTRESFEKLNNSIDNVSQTIKEIEMLNTNMLGVKSQIEIIVNNLSAKATENIEATEDMSSITEEQLAIINNIVEMMGGLAESAASLSDEISVFRTEE